jgi:branched-chain amino acid transport system ATP-binding protein
MTAMRSMLKVTGLSVRYGAIRALTSVSFEVAEGEIVTFVGANGAGKTTTLRALSGVLPVAEGKIEFLGRDITNTPSHTIVSLGMVQSPEGRMVFPDLTVRENLLMGAYSRKAHASELDAELDHIFELFPRMKERVNQNAMTLSGGEQQMLAIGRALMAKPRLLLLDEPSLGIAPILAGQIFERIVQLNRDGMTVLLAEQNAMAALAMAHRGYVLEVGEIVKSGQGRQLLQDPVVRKAYLGG